MKATTITAAIIAIGDELLSGRTSNNNARWIAQQLTAIGVECRSQIVVADEHDSIVFAVRQAMSDHHIVVTSGGLGATHDDITRPAVAEALGCELVRDEHLAERLRDLYGKRGNQINERELCQADLPEGSHASSLIPGTAPGIAAPTETGTLYCLPGVPSEMREMMSHWVLPEISERCSIGNQGQEIEMSVWGMPESLVSEITGSVVTQALIDGKVSVAYLPDDALGVAIKIKGDPTDSEQLANSIADLLGTEHLISYDGTAIPERVIQLASERKLTVATAETATGGLISTMLSSIAGSDQITLGGVISMGQHSRNQLYMMAGEPADSPAYVEHAASKTAQLFKADLVIATSGEFYGDNGQPYIWAATWKQGQSQHAKIKLPSGDYDKFTHYALAALNLLRLRLS